MGHLEVTRVDLLFAVSLAWFAINIVGLIYLIFFE